MGRTKTSKHRGKRTHGRGKKAGRGAGKRGGKGMAGGHKHRFIHILKNYGPEYFGMHGFKRPQKVSKAMITINIADLKRLKSNDHVKETKGKILMDLKSMGIDKLLGTGTPTTKMEITVAHASAKAVEKIEAAGGKVNIVSVNTVKTNSGTGK